MNMQELDMDEYYFEIPEVDVNFEKLARSMLDEQRLKEMIQKWEPGANRTFWNLPLYGFEEELNQIYQQFTVTFYSPRLFVFKPYIISHPHRDNRKAAFNICLAGNTEKDPTFFYDDEGKFVGQLNYKLGKIYCLNVSKLHSGQSIHSQRRVLLSLTTPSELSYEDLLDLYRKGKLVRRANTLEFYYRSKEEAQQFSVPEKFEKLRVLLSERLQFDHEFFIVPGSYSSTDWFAFGYRMQDAERFYCIGNLFTVLSLIETRFQVRVVDLMSAYYDTCPYKW